MKKLYYEEDNGEFYWVKETPKGFVIEWVAKFNCDGEKTPLDQNVKWGNTLKVSKKNSKHCLKSFSDEHILIYPFQSGQPFYLTLAKEEDLENEIKDCKKWGISSQYYQDLMPFINPLIPSMKKKLSKII